MYILLVKSEKSNILTTATASDSTVSVRLLAILYLNMLTLTSYPQQTLTHGRVNTMYSHILITNSC